MSQEDTKSIIKIAQIHEKRLSQALGKVQHLFPMTAQKVQDISENDFFVLETLTSRFSRLQDLMGSKLFDICLRSLGEATDGLSMIDKANKLEKSGILNSAHMWMDMRHLRNSLTHEYPDQPEITADILNKLYVTINPMLDFYQKMLSAIQNSKLK